MAHARLRLLLVSLQDWPQACRIPKHLSLAGFDVSVFTGVGETVNLSRFPVQFFHVNPDASDPLMMQGLAMALRNVCASLQPHAILPVDEVSVTLLNYLEIFVHRNPSPENQQIAQLVLDARGSPTHHQAARSKLLAPALAREAGLLTPAQTNCVGMLAAQRFAEVHGYPVVMKAEYGTSGEGVSICRSAADVQTAWTGEPVAMQSYIEGQRHFCDGLAHRGRLVCANGFEVLHVYPTPTSPSTVIRAVHQPALLAASQQFVEHIGLSGIFSIDFIVTAGGDSYFLECNPRCTPSTYLGALAGNDLFTALFDTLHSRPVEQNRTTDTLIALFPKEYLRDPASPYLWKAFHDVPWDEPALLRHFMRVAESARVDSDNG